MFRSPLTPVLWFSIASLLAAAAQAQQPAAGGSNTGGGAPAAGVNREQMWFAPTAEDWKKPCLVKWERTWEDAVDLSKRSGKPLLVCVNMDGEIASEHYAGVRYRRPETAKLYEPYVAVIASVYRHTPRDFDENGNRILCPRFGSVTCGEHITMEPILFEKYMDGKRIAPRHIMVEIDAQGNPTDKRSASSLLAATGPEKFDVYYAFDTDTIFNSLKEGVANRPPSTWSPNDSDRPLADRVFSRDRETRESIETSYRAGDAATRRTLLEATLGASDNKPVDLLRLAIHGNDADLAKLARRSLAESQNSNTVDLVSDALRAPMDAAEREGLVANLERLGEQSPRARTLALVQRGLSSATSTVDVDGWVKAYEKSKDAAATGMDLVLTTRLADQAQAATSTDPMARLELAEACIDKAVTPGTEEKFGRLMFEDAYRIGHEAEAMGAQGWRVHSVIAIAAWHLEKVEEALQRSENAASQLPPDASSYASMAVLDLFTRQRQDQIKKAVQQKATWPPQWLADINAAYTLLSQHPLGNDRQATEHHDFLLWLDARGPAARVLEEGLERFPESWTLHDRLRAQLIRERGVENLEPAYTALLDSKKHWPNLEWFAGFASIIAAEYHKRAREDKEADSAYDRALAHYERGVAANPEIRENSDFYAAIALGGKARLAAEHGDLDRAVELLIASFERKPQAAGTLDGLNVSPSDTSRMLRAKLTVAKREDLLARLQSALDKLDPALLALPAYESDGSGNRPRRNGRPR